MWYVSVVCECSECYLLQDGNRLSISVIGYANNHVKQDDDRPTNISAADAYNYDAPVDNVLPSNYQGPQTGQEVYSYLLAHTTGYCIGRTHCSLTHFPPSPIHSLTHSAPTNSLKSH